MLFSASAILPFLSVAAAQYGSSDYGSSDTSSSDTSSSTSNSQAVKIGRAHV